jgi:formylglycine-generating enzyme required for sulfatase activity
MKMSCFRPFGICIVLAVAFHGCGGGGDGTKPPTDTTSPARVTDLVVSATTTNTVTLSWTSPGDDGQNGQAAAYDLRFAQGEADAFVYDSAGRVTVSTRPKPAGQPETVMVGGVTPNTLYQFALRTLDDASNASPVSNVATGRTAPGPNGPFGEVTPPSLDFQSVEIGASRELSFTIRNAGTGTLVGSVSESSDQFSVVVGAGDYRLDAVQQRLVTVRFSPTLSGSHSCLIDTGSPECPDVPCTGIGGTPPPPVQMVLVPAGPFTMGSDAGEGSPDETPEHTPTISAFYMDRYETSNDYYAIGLNWARAHGLVTVEDGVVLSTGAPSRAFVYLSDFTNEDNRCGIVWDGSAFSVRAGFENHPVVSVTWYGAAAYCNWRSAMLGIPLSYNTSTWECSPEVHGVRLPTEAEWEKAARGAADERTYPWGEGLDCSRCNYGWGPPCVGHPVAVDNSAYAAGDSPYALRHLGGNVREWCNDWFQGDYYGVSPDQDPSGRATGDTKVVRGGGWSDDPDEVRCASRTAAGPEERSDRLGLRTVLWAEGGTPACQLEPVSLSFEIAAGGWYQKTFQIRNIGGGTLTGAVSASCPQFTIVSGGGAYALGLGQWREVTVQFTPTAAGTYYCTIATGNVDCPGVGCTGVAL